MTAFRPCGPWRGATADAGFLFHGSQIPHSDVHRRNDLCGTHASHVLQVFENTHIVKKIADLDRPEKHHELC